MRDWKRSQENYVKWILGLEMIPPYYIVTEECKIEEMDMNVLRRRWNTKRKWEPEKMVAKECTKERVKTVENGKDQNTE